LVMTAGPCGVLLEEMQMRRELAEMFWDTVHSTDKVDSLGEAKPREFFDLFKSIGPFEGEFKESDSVIDVGPGKAHLLAAFQGKKKYAVEISEVARGRLSKTGVKSFSPFDRPRELNVDLAWCVSVFQHCDEAMLSVLLNWIHTALRVEGVAYLQGVELIPGATAPETDSGKLSAGLFTRPLIMLKAAAIDVGLQPAQWSVGAPVPGTPVRGYVLRCVKW
jgi:hypothetical protein